MSRRSTSALWLALALGAWPTAGPAQVTSEIIRDGSVGNPDLTVQPSATADAQGRLVYEIGESLGERPGGGPNLFHSFTTFDLASGDRAVFSADPSLRTERVLTRVTGGRPSLLHGALESRIPGADLYFLNPAGIVFGPDAELHVDGSVIATTAHALEFARGEVFAARTDSAAPLLQAPEVAAFGFLERPAGIRALGSSLAVKSGKTRSSGTAR